MSRLTRTHQLMDEKLSNLEALELVLRDRFLGRFDRHSPRYDRSTITAGPDIYGHEVKAYAVLLHAGVEEYIEILSTRTVSHAVANWKINRKITLPIVALASCAAKADFENHEELIDRNPLLGRTITESKKYHSISVKHNHGIGPKYLNKMLIPAGIQFPSDPRLVSALKKLVELRGEYAHQLSAKEVPPPEDIIKYGKDCIELARCLRGEALKVLEIA